MILEFECDCGALGGNVDSQNFADNRAVCYCDDCQAYAHYLGRQDTLDAHGGSDIIPLTAAHFKFSKGTENLKCLMLSSKGMLRWYANCCKTPIANTPASSAFPYVGYLKKSLLKKNSESKIEEVFGLIKYRINAKFAVGSPPPGSLKKVSPGFVLNVIKFALLGVLRGEKKPSEFFTSGGHSKREPQILPFAATEALPQKPRKL